MHIDEKDKSTLTLAVVASLTLGLAPFFPEPHLLGKLRWVLGGGAGMQIMDYFDLLMHSAPWLLLIFTVGRIYFKNRIRNVK
ncbi:MAG: hypothetical protein KDC80_26445 [Saprospiraceae bacterium]|nr:hypothetical protein [Saprospiraceae bacterium]